MLDGLHYNNLKIILVLKNTYRVNISTAFATDIFRQANHAYPSFCNLKPGNKQEKTLEAVHFHRLCHCYCLLILTLYATLSKHDDDDHDDDDDNDNVWQTQPLNMRVGNHRQTEFLPL